MGIYDYEREARQDTNFATDNSNSEWSSVYGEPSDQESEATPKESPYSTPTGFNWGQGNAQIGGSSGEDGGDDDMSWATPFAQTTQKTGVRGGGITTTPGTVKPYATMQESTFAPRKGTVAPTFAAPVYDEREVKKRARKLSAPGLSQLNMKVQSAMAQYYENPNVRRMVLRDTLAGYGIGLSNIISKSQQAAQSEYGAEHARLYGEAMNSYNTLMASYVQQGSKVTATRGVNKADYEETMQYKKA